MDINGHHVYPTECSNSLTFFGFPAFLDWASSNWDCCPVGGEYELLYWTGFYSNFLSSPYMANLSVILTLLAGSFLEYDRVRGVITEKEKAWWFNVWQEKILSTLGQCDCLAARKKAFLALDQDIVTTEKTFNI